MVHSHENKRDAFFPNKTIKRKLWGQGRVTSDKENVSGKKFFLKNECES